MNLYHIRRLSKSQTKLSIFLEEKTPSSFRKHSSIKPFFGRLLVKVTASIIFYILLAKRHILQDSFSPFAFHPVSIMESPQHNGVPGVLSFFKKTQSGRRFASQNLVQEEILGLLFCPLTTKAIFFSVLRNLPLTFGWLLASWTLHLC